MTPHITRAVGRVSVAAIVWLLVGLFAVIGSATIAYALADSRSAGRGERRQVEEVAICERANNGRAVAIVNAQTNRDAAPTRALRKAYQENVDRFLAVSPLIDCVKAVESGDDDVPLPPDAVDEVLDIVRMNQTPRRLSDEKAEYVQ